MIDTRYYSRIVTPFLGGYTRCAHLPRTLFASFSPVISSHRAPIISTGKEKLVFSATLRFARACQSSSRIASPRWSRSRCSGEPTNGRTIGVDGRRETKKLRRDPRYADERVILPTPVASGATPFSVNRFNDISDVPGDDLFDVRWLTWVTRRRGTGGEGEGPPPLRRKYSKQKLL